MREKWKSFVHSLKRRACLTRYARRRLKKSIGWRKCRQALQKAESFVIMWIGCSAYHGTIRLKMISIWARRNRFSMRIIMDLISLRSECSNIWQFRSW
ncbi:hypothetical protein D3C78_896150 [compost metagenome]